MKKGKKIGLVLGLAAGAAAAIFVGKSTKKIKKNYLEKRTYVETNDNDVHYI